jgi:hypothetical protein
MKHYTTYKMFNKQKVNSNYYGIKIVYILFHFFRCPLFNDLIWICNLQNQNSTTNKPNKMDYYL